MSIIRTLHNHENPFVQINKRALWDDQLSLEAVGLWTRLLSRPDNWQVNVSELVKSCKCGKNKIYRMLNELIAQGYAYRYQSKDNGKFDKSIFYVFEFKASKEEIQKMLPLPCFPDTEKPDPENRDVNNSNIPIGPNRKKKEKESKEKNPPSSIVSKFLEREPQVFVSDTEHQKLIDQFGEPKVKECYKRLSEWKLDTPKYRWKKNDYRSILRWVINAIFEDEKNKIKVDKVVSIKQEENDQEILTKNRDFAEKIKTKFTDRLSKNFIATAWHDRFEIRNKNDLEQIFSCRFTETNFKENCEKFIKSIDNVCVV